MENRKYLSRVWRTKILLKEAEKSLDTMLTALLPENYDYSIESCDKEVDGFPFAPHWKFLGKLTPTTDSPHWVAYSYSEAGVKAKLLGMCFENRPVYPLT